MDLHGCSYSVRNLQDGVQFIVEFPE
ncbi:hypothetical protein [Paenibacillus sp. D2_2]